MKISPTGNDVDAKTPTSHSLLRHPYDSKYQTPIEIYLATAINELILVNTEVEEKTYYFGENPLLIQRKTLVIQTSEGVYRFPETHLKHKFNQFGILFCCHY
jgi:hypothetical protein